eukprot:gene11351-23758_t
MEFNDSKQLLTGIGLQKCKVSSVLNKLAEFAGSNMFDYERDSCWNSDQGTPQFVLIDFNRIVNMSEIRIAFQGGFVGQRSIIEGGITLENLTYIDEIHPLDDNSLQTFNFPSQTNPPIQCRYFRLTFPESTDFYGRITIYKLM